MSEHLKTAGGIARLMKERAALSLGPWPQDLQLFIFGTTSGWKCGATAAVEKIKTEWAPKQNAANELYQKTLRELKAEGHDAGKFVQYKDQLDRLKPKEAELKTRNKTLGQQQKARRELLAKWDAAKAEDYRELQKAPAKCQNA